MNTRQSTIPSVWSRQDSRLTAILFFVVGVVLFASVTGVTSSNDGSHYALLRAVAEDSSFVITPYQQFAEYQDVAYNGDIVYSDRPPGTALMAVPFYLMGRVFIPDNAGILPSKHDAENPHLPFALVLSPLAAACMVSLFFASLRRHFGIRRGAAFVTALGLAFGTIVWRYGAVLFSHALAVFLVYLALYCLFELVDGLSDHHLVWALFGFALGYSLLVEYSSAVFVAMVGLYSIVQLGPRIISDLGNDGNRRQALISTGMFVVVGALPILFLVWYNWLNFENPFSLSTSNVDLERWQENASLAARFSTPLFEGLRAVLFSDGNNQGLFLLSPITLMALPGLFVGFKRGMIEGYNRRLFLLLAVFVFYQGLFASLTYYNPFTNDGRYIVTFMPLWFVFVGFGIESITKSLRCKRPNWASMALVSFLFWLSVRNQVWHIAFSWNYDLDLGTLPTLAFHPEALGLVFGTVFANIHNYAAMLFFVICAVILFILVYAIATLIGASGEGQIYDSST